MSELSNELVEFKFPKKKTNNIIKVIGVGGGGSNAVNHMYEEGIQDVDFVVCNTDNQDLSLSPIDNKLQLGHEGLGAGNIPERGREAAEESKDEINEMLGEDTKMVFITAGMGGGTGTGAAPVIAELAHKKNILTVAIVTIPFKFEGPVKIDKALDGVENLSKYVDALLVINNERLRKLYADLCMANAFKKADDTLCIAARSITDIINISGYMNLDFSDVRTVLTNGGVAIMSTGYGEGEDRVNKAIQDALNSPLLSNNDIYKSKKIIFSFTHDPNSVLMDELDAIDDFMKNFGNDIESKTGMFYDTSLGDKVKVTILATGFGLRSIPEFDAHKHNEEDVDVEELKKREKELTERRALYYNDGDTPVNINKAYNTYIFKDEDLNDEELLSLIETTPTYKRTRNMLKKIIDSHNEYKEDTHVEKDGVISFN